MITIIANNESINTLEEGSKVFLRKDGDIIEGPRTIETVLIDVTQKAVLVNYIINGTKYSSEQVISMYDTYNKISDMLTAERTAEYAELANEVRKYDKSILR